MTMAYDIVATGHHETAAKTDQTDGMSEVGQLTRQRSGNQFPSDCTTNWRGQILKQ